jgi:hypothetical protein
MSGGHGEERPGEGVQSEGGATYSAVASPPVLESLAPRYDHEQHGTYLRHLEAQVANPKNLNIALTGRYGAGKSSVLDKFEEKHKDETLRLGISTLGPADAGAELNNRIQKELVKQLLYQASPGLLRHSRFRRVEPRGRVVTFVQSLLAVAVVGGLLAFIGWLPPVAGTGPGHDGWVRAVSWVGFGLLLVLVLTVLRLAVLDRREVSGVSAAGASVTLTTKNGTYFDEYLDEIVYFFDKEAPRYVIFEDLDRFDDPHIFEALRELNTLLNNTNERKKKRFPLQFIYAIKDSLFEKLGTDTKDAGADATAAETVRANRTKFFEVVIPVVPFISHRNARELLTDLLADRGITGIDRRLIDLVARHSTDMRLLRNICNEFQVFSERLLEAKHTAPGLTPSNLFALVAYKNYHLKDFEQISRRNSDLDLLYDASRALINKSIEDFERQKRELSDGWALAQSRRSLAKKLGERLLALGLSLKAGSGYAGWPHVCFLAGGKRFTSDEAGSYDFWRTVAETPEIAVHASYDRSATQQFAHLAGKEHLSVLFPEAFQPGLWDQVDGQQIHERLDALDRDIALLRGADFADLARDVRFRLTTGADEGRDEVANEEKTFTHLIDATMKSELARELVRQGYVDRNFALYAAQFYGHFTGVDVANFLVRNAQANTIDIQYPFTSPGSVANLLAEAPSDFTHTVSAFNIAILDYLFSKGDRKAQDIVNLMMRHIGPESSQFLAAFLNADRGPERLAAALSGQGWPNIFLHLVSDDRIPGDRRVPFVDAALLAADAGLTYKLDGQVCEFITEHYKSMRALTMAQDPEVTRTVAALLQKLGIVIPELEPLDPALRTEVIRQHRYTITAGNLRCALGVTGSVSLDVVHDNYDVYGYCREHAESYLHALEKDGETPHTIVKETTLVTVLNDVCDKWHEETIARLLSGASADSRLMRLTDTSHDCWATLASAKLFRPTLQNVDAYRKHAGAIDQPLADLLADSKVIETEDESEEARQATALAILNAPDTLAQAALRVQLVLSLDLKDYIEVFAIAPEPGSLLALLLKEDLVNDSPEVFLHFRPAGWETIEQAIAKSEKFTDFFDTELAAGFIPDLLLSGHVPSEVRETIIDNLDRFVPDDDEPALRAAATYACRKRHLLPPSQIHRIATATRNPETVVSLLAISPPNASEIADILAQLPEPYSYFSTRARTEFRVPNNSDLQTLLNVMSKGQIVASHNKQRFQNTRTVRLA